MNKVWCVFSVLSDKCYSIHSVICLKTSPAISLFQSAFSIAWIWFFLFQFPASFPLSLRSSSGRLPLPPHLPITSIFPCIFSSLKFSRRQFLQDITNPVAFLLFVLLNYIPFFFDSTKYFFIFHTIRPTDLHRRLG